MTEGSLAPQPALTLESHLRNSTENGEKISAGEFLKDHRSRHGKNHDRKAARDVHNLLGAAHPAAEEQINSHRVKNVTGPIDKSFQRRLAQRSHNDSSNAPPHEYTVNGSESAAERLASGVAVPELSQWRITLTPAALVDSAAIIVMANGAAKADAIGAAIDFPADVERYPAQLLRDAGDRVEWIMDSAAAARLPAAQRG